MTGTRPHSWQQQPDIASLSPDSYTALRLQHATPEHLNLTSRRYFIGPIPEGWLRTNRRDWYRRHLHINYSSRTPTFSLADARETRRRRLSGLSGPSSTALFQHSFPQPEELSAEEDEGEGHPRALGGHGGQSLGTQGASAVLEVPRAPVQKDNVVTEEEAEEYADATSDPGEDETQSRRPTIYVDAPSDQDEAEQGKPSDQLSRAMSAQSYTTASSYRASEQPAQASGSKLPATRDVNGQRPPDGVASSSSNGGPADTFADTPAVDAVSTTCLLRNADVTKDRPAVEPRPRSSAIRSLVKGRSKNASADLDALQPARSKSSLRHLVKFDIPEDSRRAELHLKAKSAQMTIRHASTRLRRQKLKDGLIVKMERMLVRVDKAGGGVPNDFDENADLKIDSRVRDKWREYMVVCRKSISDEADFVLQFYKTRVIPEIEQQGAAKKATFTIKLQRKKTRVNLYSSLDKSVVVWHPLEGGTQIFIMQARTASNAVEWFTFLQNTMGFHRTRELQINIPDLSLTLCIMDPFEKLEATQYEAQNTDGTNEEDIMRAMREEQAVAQNLIKQCLDQLKDSPEWADVLDSWVSNQRIGLAWRRYDRLEWIHGANERKMYGTIAMQKTHELELRPKSHYPTTAVTQKKHKTLTEPLPVEGFLIRLTGQGGRARRLGLMFHKQLYFATYDQYLVFSRPPKASPPPPPRLPAAQNGQVPTAHVIAEETPETWAVDPYPLKDNKIEWLAEDSALTPAVLKLRDEDAADEAERKLQNLLNCDGYVNMADIQKVRKAQKGASPIDENIESGSDVDFDEEVDDTRHEDGATKDLDIERTLELVMRNNLIIRLQAADKARRKEWIRHLRALAKYWRHRTASDINMYKTTRAKNLAALNIDEEGEAYIGQFAKKWEVTQSYASPQLYNLCGIACCRSISMSGMLYRKPRIHAPFMRCSVILAGGTLLIFQDVLRTRTGKQRPHIHHERIANLDLRDCYIYSGLLTESDLLYQNQTFDANKPGHHALPRIYLEDGWTSTDEDVMTTFVVWHGKSKSWFRAEEGAGSNGGEQAANVSTRHKLRRVAKLGSKGRSVVFRARSRAERDHWVLAIQNEIERANVAGGQDFRIEEVKGGEGAAGGGQNGAA